jgi:hypothetical protein
VYVIHKKRVACRVEILKGLRVVRFGTLVTFDLLGIYRLKTNAEVAKEERKGRYGSIAATACLGQLSRLYRLRVWLTVLSFGLRVFWG